MKRTITLVIAMLVLLAGGLSAAEIDWTQWNFATPTTGVMPAHGVTVTYTGDTIGTVFGYPSWQPSPPTFVGGAVSNPPLPDYGMVKLQGGDGTVNTVTFSSPVTDPVMAIWSLGQTIGSGIQATFNFRDPFTLESGGPSNEYGGSTITMNCTASTQVCGLEGNGTIQFHGTLSSISWTNPTYEYYYGFTVGAPTPEPATFAFMGTGLAGLFAGLIRRKR